MNGPLFYNWTGRRKGTPKGVDETHHYCRHQQYTLGYLLTKQNLSNIPLIDTSLAHIIADINKMYGPIHCYERNEIWACKACVQSKNTYICYVAWA